MSAAYISPKLLEGETVDLSQYAPRERTNIRLYGLACKHWTPLDVSDYKRSWANDATVVNIHGRLDRASDWLKTHLFQQDYVIQKYAEPDDSHNVLFRNPTDAMMFKLSI